MLRIGIVLLALATHVTAAAQPADRQAEEAELSQLRTPRLDTGLLAFETGAFVGTAAFFFTVAAGDDWFTEVAIGSGVATLTMGIWSTALLVRSANELRWRKAATSKNARSVRWNRAMIPYDALMTAAYVGLSIPIAVNTASEGIGGWSALAATSGAALAGLHIWSLVLNARELRRRNELGAPPVASHRRMRPLGSGFGW